MLLRIKRTLSFFILFALFLIAVLAPSFIPADFYLTPGERRPGMSLNFSYPDSNVCSPETKRDVFLRGESRFLPGLGTSLITTPVRSIFLFLSLGRSILKNLYHFESNPVKIAQYYHLGDGMK